MPGGLTSCRPCQLQLLPSNVNQQELKVSGLGSSYHDYAEHSRHKGGLDAGAV